MNERRRLSMLAGAVLIPLKSAGRAAAESFPPAPAIALAPNAERTQSANIRINRFTPKRQLSQHPIGFSFPAAQGPP